MKEKKYFRDCPSCGKQMGYMHAKTRNRAVKLNAICRSCSNTVYRTGKPHKPHSAEAKAKISLANHKHWGTDPDNPSVVKCHWRWSKKVKERDNYTCVYCHTSGVPVEAHHILSRAKHPELASLLNNGICLCVPCHKEEHRLNGII